MVEAILGKLEHIAGIAARMRASDIEELNGLSDNTPYEALEHSLNASTMCFTLLIDGVPEAMFGVGSIAMSDFGSPWLLATDKFKDHDREILRVSQEFIELAKANFTYLANYADSDNRRSLKWLRYIGFTIAPIQEAIEGRHGKKYLRFYWEKKDV